MHKIATPRPAVELAKLHHAILLRDAAQLQFDPVDRLQKHRMFVQNLEWTNSLTELDDIDLRSSFRMNKRCFCNLLDGIVLELRRATESHGGV